MFLPVSSGTGFRYRFLVRVSLALAVVRVTCVLTCVGLFTHPPAYTLHYKYLYLKHILYYKSVFWSILNIYYLSLSIGCVCMRKNP